jgi:FkbM family methyltransferase
MKNVNKIFFFISLFLFFPSLPHGKSYSLPDSRGIPLDHLLLEIFGYKKNGVFIEVGANDGIAQSNTKLLEENYGWTGILVEPSINIFSRLCTNRPFSKCFQCALGSFQEDGTYAYGDFDGHLMSSFTGRLDRPGKQKVLIRSLQSILDESGIRHIDFFSLDTEGYELNILKGIDFEKTTCDYLLIEIYNHQFESIVSFLRGKRYDLIKCLSNYNHVDNPVWDGTHNDYLFKRSIS